MLEEERTAAPLHRLVECGGVQCLRDVRQAVVQEIEGTEVVLKTKRAYNTDLWLLSLGAKDAFQLWLGFSELAQKLQYVKDPPRPCIFEVALRLSGTSFQHCICVIGKHLQELRSQ